MYEHERAFNRKLELFRSQLKKLEFTHFPSLSILKPNSTEDFVLAIDKFCEELKRQFQDFSLYLSKFIFLNPFSVSPEDNDAALQEEMIDLQYDSMLQHDYSNNELLTFYTKHVSV